MINKYIFIFIYLFRNLQKKYLITLGQITMVYVLILASF